VFLINAPWLFSGLWNIVKPMLAARTVAKVDIQGTDFLPALLEHIDITQVPRELGGTGEVSMRVPTPFPKEAYAANRPVPEGERRIELVVWAASQGDVYVAHMHAHTHTHIQ